MDARVDNPDLEDCGDFAALLQQLMDRVQRRDADLARMTAIPARTIEKWRRGEVRRPRHLADLLKLAQALALDAGQTTQLLQAAGYPDLGALHQEAQQAPDAALARLLETWSPAAAPAAADTAAGWQPRPAFQRHQLRPPIADFAGRVQETAQLVAELLHALRQGQGALISGVQGMGGVGKTELAYAVAHQLRGAFPDAQLVLDLRGSSSAPLTAAQTLQAAIRAFIPTEPLVQDLHALEQRYRAVLHGQRALILADDARDAAQVRLLLPPAGSALLITSRQRFTLPGMASIELEQLNEEEAVVLLRSICGRLSVADAQVIARTCGCLPLALRVCGGILRNDPALDVAAYMVQLTDERQRLSQLRDPDDPQLDVEVSLLSSYAQLDTPSQQVFRQLGVIIADFTTALALAVVEAPAGVDVAATLRLLLRRNLVIYDRERARWRLHDLVRDMARRQLEAQGEAEATIWRYARAAVQIANETQEQYQAGDQSMLAGVTRFDAERPHIDAAWRWAVDQAGAPAGDRLLVEAALATSNIGNLRYGPLQERITQLEDAQAAARRLEDQCGESHILNIMGSACWRFGEFRLAAQSFSQASALARARGDQSSENYALRYLGMLHKNHRQAAMHLEQNLALVRERGDRNGEGHTLEVLGSTYAELGDSLRAIACCEQALVITREVGNRQIEGYTLIDLGWVYTELQDHRRAIPYYEQAIAIACQLGDRRMEGLALSDLASSYAKLGYGEQAIACCERALIGAREVGYRQVEGYALRELARVYATLGTTAQARTIFEQALSMLEATGDRWGVARCSWYYGLLLAEQGENERALALLRAAVDYEQEIEHAQAAEHAALLAQIAATAELPFGTSA
jgi:tetratricopeptide (TPR) repeat protein/transcriptional regulator with XRE-family HTH domain